MMIKINFRQLFATSAILFSIPAAAQKQITHQQVYWISYYGQYNLGSRWCSTLELEDKRFFRNNRQLNSVLPGVYIFYRSGEGLEAGVGFIYYLSSDPADETKPVQVTVPELRPYEEVDYRQKFNHFSISHRYRVEERFIHNSNAKDLTSGYRFNFRVGYRLQLSYIIIGRPDAAGTLNAKVSDEIMFNFGRNIVYNSFDQNKIYAGLNYGISKSVQAELGYLKWFQQRSSGNQYYDRDVVRLTLYHEIRFFNE